MITSYVRNPDPPLVALLTPTGEVISEHGDLLNLDDWPAEYRVWTSYDTVRLLLMEGKGEALCWNNEEIRWRHERHDQEGWKRRPSDVHVIKLPFYERHELSVRALASWRDWLAGYGASPTSTTGSASWSLLRARIENPLWLSVGKVPPLKQTMGGRQELGPAGQGHYEGDLAQLDLPAAYASELGMLRYGGHWFEGSTLPRHRPEWWARDERCVFVRAIVKIPELPYGPLPRRPRKRQSTSLSIQAGSDYPVATRLQGCWTWQELAAAEAHGCSILRILETYVHLSGERRPFRTWWEAIQEGRSMPGLAGLLAKTTGNALWGRFAMDSGRNGKRTIRSIGKNGKIVSRPYITKGNRPPSHDLAETVSGRVRAKLYEAMMLSGADLLSAHTDGIWCRSSKDLLSGLPEWRRKQEARGLDLLDPQVLRYQPKRGRPQTVFAGMPALLADEEFERRWSSFIEEKT